MHTKSGFYPLLWFSKNQPNIIRVRPLKLLKLMQHKPFLVLLIFLVSACKQAPVQLTHSGSVEQHHIVRLSGMQAFCGQQALPASLVSAQYSGQTLLLSLSGDLSALTGEDTCRLRFDSLPGVSHGLLLWRYGPWKAWTRPMQLTGGEQLPYDEVQFALWQYADSTYGVAVPLSDGNTRCSFGFDQKRFQAVFSSFAPATYADTLPVMALGFGRDPYELIRTVYRQALTCMGKADNLREQKNYPEALEYWGWCTWNGLGTAVSTDKISTCLDQFKKTGTPVPMLIIDDGWHQINALRQLTHLEPDPAKFPGGFAPAVAHWKSHYGVKHVGAWVAMNAYWNGIDPQSEIGRKHAANLFTFAEYDTLWTSTPGVSYQVPDPSSDKGQAIYDEWFALLKQQGIDFLKVDNQLCLERIARGQLPIAKAAANMHRNFRQPLKTHFNNTVINCMDMTSDAYYNFGTTAVARCVEDYFPYEPSETYNLQKGNAAVHVQSAIYNALYFSQMVWPDYDMFQTTHPHAAYHAVARAISGGPVYLTDAPGQTDVSILKRLVYSNGRVIRALQPALPTADCLFQVQDAAPFKAFTLTNHTGLLAVFNAADAGQVSGTIGASDVYGLSAKKVVIYDWYQGSCQIVPTTQRLPIELKRMEHRLYLLAPFDGTFAPLGLLDKYNAPATIVQSKVSQNMLDVTLYEGGRFGCVCASKPARVEVNGQVVTDWTFKSPLLVINLPEGSKEPQLKIVL